MLLFFWKKRSSDKGNYPLRGVIHPDLFLFNLRNRYMKKIIALLMSALFASAAFAATPAMEKPVSQADSESLVITNGSNNTVEDEKTADDAPLAADAAGAQDDDD